MSPLSTLPAPLTNLVVPRYLSPSLVADDESCPVPLLVGAPDRAGVLAPTAGAVFGTVLHAARARWRVQAAERVPPGVVRHEVDALLTAVVAEQEAVLSDDSRTERLVPLRDAVGETRFTEGWMQLRRWAKGGVAAVPGPEPVQGGWFSRAPSNAERPDAWGLGIEPWIVSNGHRLRGRPDLLARTASGVLIADDKTGAAVDEEGFVLHRHRLQLGLYAVMVEEVAGIDNIELAVIDARTHRFGWTPVLRSAVHSVLEAATERFPAGSDQEVEGIAKPGDGCCRCRLRPVCPAYAATAPGWWDGSATRPTRVPPDTWGVVIGRRDAGGLAHLTVRDAAGRRVQVQGVDPSLSPEEGAGIWAFELEATQRTVQHGRRLAPTSLHIEPPDGGRRWKRARRALLFAA